MQQYGCQDLVQELDHLQNLCSMLPDSPVAASMASTFCTKLKSYQSWSSEAICQLLAKTQASTFPEAMKSGILDTIQNLSTSQGSHLKLVNSGQSVPNLAPYLTHSDWTALTTYVTQTDQLQVLAKRLKGMGVQSLKEGTKAQGCGRNVDGPIWPRQAMPQPRLHHLCRRRLCSGFPSFASDKLPGSSDLPGQPQRDGRSLAGKSLPHGQATGPGALHGAMAEEGPRLA